MSDFGFGFGFYDFYSFYDSDNASDSNGSFGDAQFVGSLRSDFSLSGNVGGYGYGFGYYSDFNDYFEFELLDNRNVVIKTDETDITVALYDHQQRYLGSLNEDGYGGDYARSKGDEVGLAVSLSQGNYYLRVNGGSNFTDYKIDLNAASDDDDRLNDAQRLGTLDCSKRLSGQVGQLDFGDSYRFRPGRSGTFTISQTDNLNNKRRPELRLYDDNQDLIATGSAQIRRSLADDRDYYLRVAAEDAEASQSYRVTLTPNSVYQGTSRDDRLQGCADDDILRGFAGNDQLIGQKGADQLLGGADDDRLQGDAGNDRLEGGGGFDSLSGGKGRDIFVLRDNDRIRDFQDGLDRLELPKQLTFGDLSITQQGRNLALRFGDRDLASLVGLQATQLDASDFV